MGAFAANTLSEALKVDDFHGTQTVLNSGNTLKVSNKPFEFSINRHGPWLMDGGISGNSQQLISMLKDAEAHGLNSDNYGLPKILFTVKKILELDYGKSVADELSVTELNTLKASLRRDLDRQMDDAFLRLARDLGRGVTKATKVQRQMFREAPKVNPEEWLDAVDRGEISAKSALQLSLIHI